MKSSDVFDPGLAGKRALVIGSGPGIGLETVRILAGLGATVGAVDLNFASARDAVTDLPGTGHLAFECDVLEESAVEQLKQRVDESFSIPDILVNVVGIGGPPYALKDTPTGVWDDMVGINLRQQFVVARTFLSPMIERGSGSLVLISSINAQQSSPLRSPYGVAKAGLDSLVRSMAIEGAAHGVRVNSVRPGSTRTPRREHLARGQLGELYRQEIPIGRLAEPVDVANVVVFLASNLARHITGEHVTVDGGSTIRYSQPVGN